ncbi:MAG: hypothetical protein HYZ28_06280 [Myxococcales bacterium]|nr:hypothetical protein [Myxococcales bacterium]
MKELEQALLDLSTRVGRKRRGLFLVEDGEQRPIGRGEEAVRALRDFIYARYFCRWQPTGARHSRYSDRSSGEPSFVAALLSASRGACYWEAGWKVCKASERWAFVSNGSLVLFVEERRTLSPPDAEVGAEVHLRLPCARENLAPGFFYLIGRAGPIDHSRPHVKLYLNLSPEAAPLLVELLVCAPGVERSFFEAKLVNDPAAYCRVDTALLYLEPAACGRMVSRLRQLAAAHPGAFREGTPLLTRPLARGLAAAESPAFGELPQESFGQHRCRLLARAVAESLEKKEPPHAWMEKAAEAFAREGLRLSEPYLKELPVEAFSARLRPRRSR